MGTVGSDMDDRTRGRRTVGLLRKRHIQQYSRAKERACEVHTWSTLALSSIRASASPM